MFEYYIFGQNNSSNSAKLLYRIISYSFSDFKFNLENLPENRLVAEADSGISLYEIIAKLSLFCTILIKSLSLFYELESKTRNVFSL